MPNGYSCLSGVCDYQEGKKYGDVGNGHTHKCDKPATRTTTIKGIPELVVLEIFKSDALPLKWDPHIDLEFHVLQYHFKLTGLIYHSQARAHYWSELYVDKHNRYGVSPGWYSHDGLANGGKCIKTGNHPNLQVHGHHLSLPFFERQKPTENTQTPTCTS